MVLRNKVHDRYFIWYKNEKSIRNQSDSNDQAEEKQYSDNEGRWKR
jgi:hypothetical protein